MPLTINDIYGGAERLINQLLSVEAEAQGHVLDGTMSESFNGKISSSGSEKKLEGYAVKYADYVNDGVRPESASMKQFPFLVAFFRKRGFDEKAAKGFAAATIKKWMKEGMSTQASKRFSNTGSRQNFIEAAFIGGDDKIDSYMSVTFDQSVEERYRQAKSETI